MKSNAIIHGDCKINNVLFDQQGERVLSVIDLDNNMSGHWAWDFGDLVRSVSFSRGGFDEEDYRACLLGFLAGRGSDRVVNEHLVSAPSYLAFMLGLRFLTDHLSGDIYSPCLSTAPICNERYNSSLYFSPLKRVKL